MRKKFTIDCVVLDILHFNHESEIDEDLDSSEEEIEFKGPGRKPKNYRHSSRIIIPQPNSHSSEERRQKERTGGVYFPREFSDKHIDILKGRMCRITITHDKRNDNTYPRRYDIETIDSSGPYLRIVTDTFRIKEAFY